MRQSHRKAIWHILTGILVVASCPLWMVAFAAAWISNKLADVCDILGYLLRIDDVDITPENEKK